MLEWPAAVAHYYAQMSGHSALCTNLRALRLIYLLKLGKSVVGFRVGSTHKRCSRIYRKKVQK